jgi:hypothetical protein
MSEHFSPSEHFYAEPQIYPDLTTSHLVIVYERDEVHGFTPHEARVIAAQALGIAEHLSDHHDTTDAEVEAALALQLRIAADLMDRRRDRRGGTVRGGRAMSAHDHLLELCRHPSGRRKLTYATRAKAAKAARELSGRRGLAGPPRAYKCRICPGWHITTTAKRPER